MTTAAAVKIWKQKHPEKVAAQKARWRARYPNYLRDWRRRNPEKVQGYRKAAR